MRSLGNKYGKEISFQNSPFNIKVGCLFSPGAVLTSSEERTFSINRVS